jgi:hypothetical protein
MSKSTRQGIFAATLWTMNGKFHRDDGPAVINADGTVRWFFNGTKYEFNEWLEAVPDLTYEDKVMYKLKYG